MQRKYIRPQKHLNLKLIRPNYICQGTAIHNTLAVFSLIDLEAHLIQKETVTKMTKRKLSGLHYLILGI